MELIKNKKRVRLYNLPNGQMFTTEKYSCIAIKSEYRTDKGACECYIIGSGEMFWGGTHTANDLNNLLVYPIKTTGVI